MNKRLTVTSRAVVKKFNWSFALVGSRSPELWDIKNIKKVNPTETDIKAMASVSHKWSVLLSVIMRSQDGQEFAKSIQITTCEAYKQSELTGVLSDNHAQLIREQNENHIVNVAWVARPDSIDWDEILAGEIYRKMGAWDTLAKWETLQQQ